MAERNGTSKLPRNVVLLGLTSLLNDVSSEIIYPLLPLFLTTVLAATPGYIGVIEGIADSTSSFIRLASGWLSDRRRRRKGLVVWGYAIAGGARPLIAVVAAPWQVLIIRFIDRVGKGIRSAPRDALLAESGKPARLGWAFGFHRAMDNLGAVIGPLIAFILVSKLGAEFRVVFALASLPGLCAVALVSLGVREPEARATAGPPTITSHRVLSPPLRIFLLAILCFTLGNSSDAFLLLRAQSLGISVAALPLLWALLHVVKSATAVPGGQLSDRVGRLPVILLGWTVYVLVYVGLALAQGPVAVWVLFAVYGLFFGLTEGTERALIADLVPASDRGAAFGLYHFTVGVGALPASLLCGALWEWKGPATAFAAGAVLAGLASVLLATLLRHRRREHLGRSAVQDEFR